MQIKLSSLFTPKYWPYWLLLGVLRLLVMLPYKAQLFLGKWLGRLLARLPSKSRDAAKINLKLCFPQYSASERQQLLVKSFESVGIACFETALGWWGTEKQLQAIPVSLTGSEHLTAAVQKGKGVMLCSPHFTTLELTGRLFARKVPIAVMYRPQKKELLEYITRRALDKHYQGVIARNDIRGMLRALRGKVPVWYAADIDAGAKNSVFAPFFGVIAATITATSRYAELTGATVIPAFFYRRVDGSGYEIVLNPPLENFPSAQLEQDAQRINQVFELAIQKRPEQYLWQYKRFKTRPNNEPRFY